MIEETQLNNFEEYTNFVKEKSGNLPEVEPKCYPVRVFMLNGKFVWYTTNSKDTKSLDEYCRKELNMNTNCGHKRIEYSPKVRAEGNEFHIKECFKCLDCLATFTKEGGNRVVVVKQDLKL